jgi:hypothetical protein
MPRRGCRASLMFAALLLTGCGPSLVKTEGVVTLDGQPVEGATVMFVSEDGNRSYTGFTDAAGKFSLASGEKPGATAGTYKVTVMKTPKVAGAESMAPGNPDYLKHMAKESQDAAKVSGPGRMMMPKPGGGTAVKSELPAVYATTATTPLTAKVPSDGPVKVDLKSKP